MTAPVISIIIPTRDRAETLSYTLATALNQRTRDIEVLVSDNCSEDSTSAVAQGTGDDRVRYVRSSRRLSMCDNYEFALAHSRGEYTIIVGDDDAVMPGQIDWLIDHLKAAGEPLIHMWPLHIYDWPAEGTPARLTYYAPPIAPSELDLKRVARDAIRNGGWRYYALPSGYHSAVPRRITRAIAERTGRVFHSTQPDVFVAMAMPAFADRAINVGRPVTMNGRSPKSNGRDFLKSKNRANLDRFILEYGDYRFHPALGTQIPPLAAMIPDAVIRAKDLFPEIYADVPFGFSAMWAYVARLGFANYSHIVRQRRAIALEQPFSMPSFLTYAAMHEAAAFRRTILNWVTRPQKFTAAPSDIAALANAIEERH